MSELAFDQSASASAEGAHAPYLAHLNEAQAQAVAAVDRTGPGAGWRGHRRKTRVLTTRLAHILATRRAYPSELLAVTFTNQAAPRDAPSACGR